MIVPTKEEYCRKRAEENTYDKVEEFIDKWSMNPYTEVVHYSATPEQFYQEYDDIWNVQYIHDMIREDMCKCEILNKEISERCDHWNIKKFPDLPEVNNDNLVTYRKIRRIVEEELKRLERIRGWVN